MKTTNINNRETDGLIQTICSYQSVTSDTATSYSLDDNSIQNGDYLMDDAIGSLDLLVTGDAGVNKITKGKFGNAMDFDEDNDFLIQDTSLSYASLSAFTFSLWFYHDGETAGSGEQTLLSFGGAPGSYNSLYFWIPEKMAAGSGNFLLRARSWNSSDTILETPIQTFLNSQWHHLVITKSNTNGLSIFIDGDLKIQDSTVANSEYRNWGNFRIGFDGTNGTSSAFDGKLDEFHFWPRELTLEEIKMMYMCAPN